jgi:hypothetical protein
MMVAAQAETIPKVLNRRGGVWRRKMEKRMDRDGEP